MSTSKSATFLMSVQKKQEIAFTDRKFAQVQSAMKTAAALLIQAT